MGMPGMMPGMMGALPGQMGPGMMAPGGMPGMPDFAQMAGGMAAVPMAPQGSSCATPAMEMMGMQAGLAPNMGMPGGPNPGAMVPTTPGAGGDAALGQANGMGGAGGGGGGGAGGAAQDGPIRKD